MLFLMLDFNANASKQEQTINLMGQEFAELLLINIKFSYWLWMCCTAAFMLLMWTNFRMLEMCCMLLGCTLSTFV